MKRVESTWRYAHGYISLVMTFKEMEKLIKKDGWYLQSAIGSQYHYVHDSKKGKVTIPFHGNRELSKYVVNSILKQAGLKE